ncbi:LytTR family transcriptional regulator DNA-binding domain-containing protein [Gillisia sp. CAL575]|uniref:LytTR family transcriptional regulator DNA-binding domain-containing protein n=1 Tax=Gillisia sp. CAL575 TaxID=985255 RepID=UPI0021CD8E3D|nr:LytTR family DNA-binding domain-containing protein [Gillisia sp. CAL575]
MDRTLPNNFMRVHKSSIINKNKLTGLKRRDLLLSELRIPVSDSYYDLVKKELL